MGRDGVTRPAETFPVDDRTIAQWRLRSLGLTRPPWGTPADVVAGLLAVQAENPSQSAWAVATRCGDMVTATQVATALSEGQLLRTHLLRPTWHYVRPDDLVWLLELTGPRVHRLVETQQRELGVDDTTLEAAVAVVVDALDRGSHLSRPELADRLADAGLPSQGPAVSMVMIHLELTAVVCSGAPRDGEHTYALVSERAPRARRLHREEALGELALRYVSGHGPVTERDLAYWATLPIRDVRAGLSHVADRLHRFDHDGRTWWVAEPIPADVTPDPRGHLLQVLDEYHNGVQDTRHVLDVAGLRPAGRPGTVGMAVVDGQVLGGMRRTVMSESVGFEVTPYRTLAPDEIEALAAAGDRYGAFLGRAATVTIADE